MVFFKALSKGTLIAALFFFIDASAQVSFVEGISPLDGVRITKSAQPVQSVLPGVVFKDCEECPEMVAIPSGSFLMGSPFDQPDLFESEPDPFSNEPVKKIEKIKQVSSEDERPQHHVEIKGFGLGRYEVTQEQWFAVMGNNPSSNKGRTLPVENVSWDAAQLFVQKLSQKTGKNYRLPSEAEWEYAARAGTTTQYFWGGDEKLINDFAWHSDNSGGKSHLFGLKKPNQFGLSDMIGNLYEWTQDCWNENYKGAPTDGSAWAGGDCSKRILRGGSWDDFPLYLRSAFRYFLTTDGRSYIIGFRVARDIELPRLNDEIQISDLIRKENETDQLNLNNNQSQNNSIDKNKADLIPLKKSGLYGEGKSETSISLPKVLENSQVDYPRMSVKLGEQGQVMVRVFVGVDGVPQKVELQTSSGFERVDKAGMDAAMRWRYVPGKRGSVAEAMWFLQPIAFSLKKEESEKPSLLLKLLNVFK